jgi:hypothetical protein
VVFADFLGVGTAVIVPKAGFAGRATIGDLKVIPVCRIHGRAADWAFHSCCGCRELARGLLKRLHFNKILKGLRILSRVMASNLYISVSCVPPAAEARRRTTSCKNYTNLRRNF